MGRSCPWKNLYYIKQGNGSEVFYNGGKTPPHHALEWITAPLLMKFIEIMPGICKEFQYPRL
jgi:g-D-glutamyl-meso-diaminopimelate peptidase